MGVKKEIKTEVVTEIVTMKIIGGVDIEEFVCIVDGLERDFHSKMEGFLDTELLYDERSCEWVMVQHWESYRQCKEASRKMFHEPGAAAFVKIVDPKSVKMRVLPQLKIWK